MEWLVLASKIVIAIGLLTIFLVIVGSMNLKSRIAWSDPTDGIDWEVSNQELKALEVTEGGPGWSAGVRTGDVLVSIDNQAIRGLEEYFGILYARGANADVSYSVRTGNLIHQVLLRLGEKKLLSPKDGMKSGAITPGSEWSTTLSTSTSKR